MAVFGHVDFLSPGYWIGLLSQRTRAAFKSLSTFTKASPDRKLKCPSPGESLKHQRGQNTELEAIAG